MTVVRAATKSAILRFAQTLVLACAIASCASLPAPDRSGANWAAGERVRWAADATRKLEIGDTACVADTRPGLRQRIVTAAASQWRAFGYPLNDWTSNSATVVPTDHGAPIVSPDNNISLDPAIRQRSAPRLGLMEDDPDAMLLIGAYWAVTSPGEIDRQNSMWAIEPSAGWALAWSAAFVSWVMCEAGVPETEFHRSGAHLTYIEQAYRGGGAYRFEASGQGPIDVGDLICAWRGAAEPMDFETGRARIDAAIAFWSLPPAEQDRLIERGGVITGPVGSHCDIVVRVDQERRRLYAIGGNVIQSVTMTILNFAIDGVAMRLETPPEHPGAPRWFAVLRLNERDAGDASLDAALSAGR